MPSTWLIRKTVAGGSCIGVMFAANIGSLISSIAFRLIAQSRSIVLASGKASMTSQYECDMYLMSGVGYKTMIV